MEDKINKIKEYFYEETEGFEIAEIELKETKASYFDVVECYYILTKQNVIFYVFSGETTFTNVYPAREGETLDECYYKHVGFIAEYSSYAVSGNFILRFIKNSSVFPILDRRMREIEAEITLDKNSSQLSGVANQIRDCYITLSDYLMNKAKSKNPNFKNDNFKDNLEEFLRIILPGNQSETRRNVINSIAQKGWKLNSELVHKDSITVFDVMLSFNILSLVVSTVSNVMVGNNMPFNKIKCPYCKSERNIMKISEDDEKQYIYVCEDCGRSFKASINDLIKDF